MGEAKNRKQTEQNYGRVPKSTNKRGLIVCPPIEIEGTRLSMKSAQLDPQELRFALLFWDQLVWPSSRILHIHSGTDALFLEQEGILTRPDYSFDGDIAAGIARGQLQAFKDRDRDEPGVWALAQGEMSLLLRDGFAEINNGALVELHRAIPIPRYDVPLSEILEFKQRRGDELLLLRYQLESFVSKIDDALDKSLELQKCIAELDEACSNLLKLGREWQFPVYLSNIKVGFSLNPTKFMGAVGGGWAVGQSIGLNAASAAALATASGVGSTIDIKGDPGIRSARRPKNPYRYAYQINEELN